MESPHDEIGRLVGKAGGVIEYAPGYEPIRCRRDERKIQEAVAVAGRAETSVLLVGLPSAYEAEGIDRADMLMPEQMVQLIRAVSAVSEKLVLVLCGGAPVELPPELSGRAVAILSMGLAGQAIGSALAALLFGLECPCGKTAETWPVRLTDCPAQRNFACHPRQVRAHRPASKCVMKRTSTRNM